MSDNGKKNKQPATLQMDKETRLILFGSLAVFVVAGFIHLADVYFHEIPFRPEAIAYVIYFAFCAMFAYYLFTDVPSRYARLFLVTCVLLLLLWQILHMIRFQFVREGGQAEIFLYYLYFAPSILAPNCILLGTLHSARPADRDIHRAWYLTLAFSLFLVIVILTNGLHQTAFALSFDSATQTTVLSYRLWYYVSMIWMFVMVLGAIVAVLRSVKIRRIKGNIWTILILLLIGGIYFLFRLRNNRLPSDDMRMFRSPEIWAFLEILGIELAVRIGALRTNYNYRAFFEASTCPISITDHLFKIHYSTAVSEPLSVGDQMRAADAPVLLDPDHRLQSRPIEGGRVYWVDDLSMLNALTMDIRDTRDGLKRENDLIRRESALRARRAQTEEKEKLFALLEKRVRSETDRIAELLRDNPPASPTFRTALARACVYKVYVKRMSNLTLLNHESGTLHAFELENSLRESLDYLRLNGLHCALRSTARGEYPGEALISLYESFQRVIEPRFLRAEEIRVDLTDDFDQPRLRVTLAGAAIGKEETEWTLPR